MTEGAPPRQGDKAMWGASDSLRGRVEGFATSVSDHALVSGALAFAALTGVASLIVYGVSGYSRGMLLLWLLGVCTFAFLFRVRSAALPRIAAIDLTLGGALMVVFSPLYLARLYDWPVQVSS